MKEGSFLLEPLKLLQNLFLIQTFLILLALQVAGCGRAELVPGKISESETACADGTVQVLVGDGYFQNLCGCNGPGENGSTYLHPDQLTCHVADKNSFVFFSFLTNTLRHQIVPVGIPFFPGSPLFDPTDERSSRSYAIQGFPEENATYTVEDAFLGMTGKFIVP